VNGNYLSYFVDRCKINNINTLLKLVFIASISHKQNQHRKVAEGSGHLGGVGSRKWDENKS
jgi:hypothetical protein